MKNKLRETLGRLKALTEKDGAAWPARLLWNVVSHNLGLKLLSLLLAILLWNYVISTNTSITRPKTLFGLTGYLSGRSALNNNGLALLEDPAPALSNVTVTVDAPQSNYSRVSNDNVQVTLDVSNIRTAGTQQVRLRATSTFGRVTSITPSALTLSFEELDSRSVPVNCQLVGEGKEDQWYNVARVNPSVITVSGAASAVRSITSACVYVDVTDVENSNVTALQYTLLNGDGEEIPSDMLNRSTSSISIGLETYPSRYIPISSAIESVITGEPAEGFVVTDVTIQPESVMVAAERDLLDSVRELKVEPLSVEGMKQGFSAKTAVSLLSDFKYVANEEVYVTVSIEEKPVKAKARASVTIEGLGENLMAETEPAEVTLVGPSDAVEAMKDDEVNLVADVSGLSAGTYQLAPSWNAEDYPGVTLEVDALEVTLVDTETEAGQEP